MLEELVLLVGDIIAFIVLAIIALGAAVTLGKLGAYIFSGFNDLKAARVRHSFMTYLSIALDFLIAKDIVLTLTLDRHHNEYQGVISLVVIVLVRVLLSYFIHLEEKVLQERHQNLHRISKKKS